MVCFVWILRVRLCSSSYEPDVVHNFIRKNKSGTGWMSKVENGVLWCSLREADIQQWNAARLN